MRAVTRNKLLNNLYLGTFLIAFSSVALGSILPCPAHTLDSESSHEIDELNESKKEHFNDKKG